MSYDWRKALICPKINKRKAQILKYPYFCDLLHEGFFDMKKHCSACHYYTKIINNVRLINKMKQAIKMERENNA